MKTFVYWWSYDRLVGRTNTGTPELYQYLKNAFRKLDENSDKIPGAGHQVEESVDSVRRQLERGDEDNWALETDPYLVFDLRSGRDFNHESGQARLGGIIEVCDGEYEMFSSSLILAIQHPTDDDGGSLPEGLDHCCIETGTEEKDEQYDAGYNFYHILERFHWDIDTGDDADDRKPVCHFQSGGKVSGSAFNDSYEKHHYCSNGLDKPRIPHPPMEPILVFNMLINQYESLESFNQAQWDGIVKEGETALWEPYYNSTHGMVSTDSSVMDLMQPSPQETG
ncbi:hypothetical protein [Halolamina pelagica]|nr:hypothetical protein [Halolamina pelagica]